MARVFVTGGAGYIGSHTILELLRDDHQVMSFDNYANSSPESLGRVQELTQKGSLQMVEGDICDRDALDAAMSTFKPDAVIHFAGLKAVGESAEKPLSYYDINVGGTLELLRAMQDHGCTSIVFSSSATVYGDAQYLPFDEVHPLGPTNPYGRTKAFVEEIIRDWVASWPDASAVLLRYFNPTGADVSGRIGEDPNGIPNNLMPYIAHVATGRLQQLGVFGNDYDTRDGTGERDYIHVSDLASAHLAALDFASGTTGCEAINVGTGNGATVLEMVAAFEVASGRPVPYQISPRRAGDVAVSVAEVDKAKDLLGWQARFNLVDMCETMWQWQSSNPDGYRGNTGPASEEQTRINPREARL